MRRKLKRPDPYRSLSKSVTEKLRKAKEAINIEMDKAIAEAARRIK